MEKRRNSDEQNKMEDKIMLQVIPKRGDENFEAMRNNKTKIPSPTKKEYQIAKFNVAIKMIQCFRYRPWMSDQDVISKKGERIDLQGKIFTPKFKRKI